MIGPFPMRRGPIIAADGIGSDCPETPAPSLVIRGVGRQFG